MNSTHMASMTASTTVAAAAATTSAMSMSMDHDMGGSCKISMLWNWYTIDACFLSSSWHVTSTGMFAGSCIGVILLVLSLEILRRLAKEYDRYLLRLHASSSPAPSPSNRDSSENLNAPKDEVGDAAVSQRAVARDARRFRPTVGQQAVRALLHMLQFAVAYFVMLLAMYYNGYIIICIFIGAFLGFFVFSWESVALGDGPKEEVTVCCG